MTNTERRMAMKKAKKTLFIRGKRIKSGIKPWIPVKRCEADGKKIFDRGMAERYARIANEEGDKRIHAYLGTCGVYHIGHTTLRTNEKNSGK